MPNQCVKRIIILTLRIPLRLGRLGEGIKENYILDKDVCLYESFCFLAFNFLFFLL